MRRSILALVLLGLSAAVPVPGSAAVVPQAVVALIDTGISPYSPAFRDTSTLAQQHPSTYIPGYPADARALRLTLDAPTVEAALAADRSTWQTVVQSDLYWIPGTKIIGAISFGRGGTSCPRGPQVPPAGAAANVFCIGDGTWAERPIFDEAGHGTMTASRATSVSGSLGAGARVVMIEGLGARGVEWAAEQPWIDVQSNSWGSLTPGTSGPTVAAFKLAAASHMVMVASGNGLGFTHGFAPQPTHAQQTAPPGVVLVGAHDNGRVSAWSEAPAHVVADGYGGITGRYDTLDPPAPHPSACCTSASAPYAAGGAAAIALEARRLLGDAATGVRAGIVAQGAAGVVPSGPLSDGVFTLAEWKAVFLATAQGRPHEGRDDGLLHFTGGPAAPQNPQHGPGENPYCEGCWTLPVRWTEVPSSVQASRSIGYGAINEFSVDLAAKVLAGQEPLPARPEEDAVYAEDQQLRARLYGG